MSVIIEYRNLAEFIYFVTSPLLLGGLIIGIIQLRAFRKESQVRIARETVNMTLSILERKCRDIFKSVGKIKNCKSAKLLPVFEGTISGFHKQKIDCNSNWIEVYESNELMDFSDLVKETLNELETLAQYIMSGITDEELCYKLEGPHILYYIEDFKIFIAATRDNENDPFCENIIKLHAIWSEKIEHDKAKEKIHALTGELANKKRPKPIEIIGS